jgi:hypothetical protein
VNKIRREAATTRACHWLVGATSGATAARDAQQRIAAKLNILARLRHVDARANTRTPLHTLLQRTGSLVCQRGGEGHRIHHHPSTPCHSGRNTNRRPKHAHPKAPLKHEQNARAGLRVNVLHVAAEHTRCGLAAVTISRLCPTIGSKWFVWFGSILIRL